MGEEAACSFLGQDLYASYIAEEIKYLSPQEDAAQDFWSVFPLGPTPLVYPFLVICKYVPSDLSKFVTSLFMLGFLNSFLVHLREEKAKYFEVMAGICKSS